MVWWLVGQQREVQLQQYCRAIFWSASRGKNGYGWKIRRTYVHVSTSPGLQVKAEKWIYKFLDACGWKTPFVVYTCLRAFNGINKPLSSGQSGNIDLHVRKTESTNLDRPLYRLFFSHDGHKRWSKPFCKLMFEQRDTQSPAWGPKTKNKNNK